MKSKTLDNQRIEIIKFLKERNWNPKTADLAKSIVIEAAELLEKYQWDGENLNPNLEEVGEEAADVFIYLIEFCNSTDIDLSTVVEDKIKKNALKYPAEMFKGKDGDRFYYQQKRKYREARNK